MAVMAFEDIKPKTKIPSFDDIAPSKIPSFDDIEPTTPQLAPEAATPAITPTPDLTGTMAPQKPTRDTTFGGAYNPFMQFAKAPTPKPIKQREIAPKPSGEPILPGPQFPSGTPKNVEHETISPVAIGKQLAGDVQTIMQAKKDIREEQLRTGATPAQTGEWLERMRIIRDRSFANLALLMPGVSKSELIQELDKSSEELSGLAPATVGAVGEVNELAMEWFTYSKMFRLTSKAFSTLGRVDKIKKLGEAVEKIGGVEKFKKAFPQIYDASKDLILAGSKGFTVGSVVGTVEGVDEGLSVGDLAKHAAKKGGTLAAISGIFSVASSIDTAVAVKQFRKSFAKAINDQMDIDLRAARKAGPGGRSAASIVKEGNLKLQQIDSESDIFRDMLTGAKAGKLLKTGQRQVESAHARAARIAREPYDPALTRKGTGRVKTGLGKPPKSKGVLEGQPVTRGEQVKHAIKHPIKTAQEVVKTAKQDIHLVKGVQRPSATKAVKPTRGIAAITPEVTTGPLDEAVKPKAVEVKKVKKPAKPLEVTKEVDYSNLDPKQEITVSTTTGKETMTVEDAVYRMDELSGEAVSELEAGESAEADEELQAITKELGKLQPLEAKQEGGKVDEAVKESDVDFDRASNAYRNISFTPEKRAKEVQKEYVEDVKSVLDEMEPLAKSSEQKEILKAEVVRYKEGYLKRLNALLDAKSRTASTMITGPANFPVAQNRKRMATEDKRRDEFLEWEEKARTAIRRKLNKQEIEDAGGELVVFQKELATAEKNQETMKAINAIVRKKGTDSEKISKIVEETDFTESQAKKLLKPERGEKVGFQGFELTNNRAKIKRMQQRLATMKIAESRSGTRKIGTFTGGEIFNNFDLERVQIVFDEKPNDAIRAALKSRGFRWSPKNNAWQRKNTNNGLSATKQVVEENFEGLKRISKAETVKAPTPPKKTGLAAIAEEVPKVEVKKAPKKKAVPKKKAGGKTGDPVSGAPNEIDRKRIKVAMEPGGKPQTARSIVEQIERAFDIPIRGKATHTMRSALGWYSPSKIGIRLKDVRAITTATHEIGHHIDRMEGGKISKKMPSAISKELMAMGKALYGKKKPQGGYKSEGWAEFIRMHLTGDDTQATAPNLHKWFHETYLLANKDVAGKLTKISKMVTKWRMQGAEARVDSQINTKEIKGTLPERAKKGLLWTEKGFRDELAPIKRAMARMGIKEGQIRPSQDPYQIAVSRADKAGAISEQFVLKYTTDLAGNRTGEGLREILAPVSKDINSFVRWAITARARLLHDKGINPGISKADANFVYDKYSSKEWQKVLRELTEWNHRVLDYLAEAGGLDSKALKRIKDSNPIYIPFMRAFKEGELRIGGGPGKGVAKTSKPVKSIKGSGREIIDPLESMIQQTHKVIAVAHKTEVARALAGLAKREGSASMIWKVPAPKQATQFQAEQLKKDIAKIAYQRMGLDPEEISSGMMETWDEVLTVFTNANQYYGKDNIISMVIDGERTFYEVDPAIYKAIEGLDLYSLPWFVDLILGKPTRMLRLGATGLNASFGLIRNFARDALTFTVLSKHAKAGPLSAVKGIAEDVMDTEKAKQFKATGGKMSSQILADRKSLQHIRKRVLVSTVGNKTIYTVAHPIDALRELFGITEAGTRIGEYSAALKYGEKKWGKGSRDAAIYALNQAQDVTTNFSRHGSIAKMLNQMIPFFNAAIQGPDKILRTLKNRPTATLLKALIGLTLPAIWLWWRNKDEEWYQNLPIYEKTNYIHFKIPGKNTIIRLPVPFELGHIFQSIPVAALDSKHRKDPKLVKETFKESLKQANPFDIPATFRPIVDVMANEDFAGRPIISKSAEYKLPEDQYGQYTTQLMKVIGKELGVSPAKLEHLVKSYSGGLYTRIARTIDLRNKKEITKSDLPILGTLFMRETYAPRAQLSRFYERSDLLNRKYSSKKITEAEKRERSHANDIRKELSSLWKKLPDTETETEKREIYKQMAELLKKPSGTGQISRKILGKKYKSKTKEKYRKK